MRPLLAALAVVMIAAPAFAGADAPPPGPRVDAGLEAQVDALRAGERVVAYAVHRDGRTAEAMAALDALALPHKDLPRVGVSQLLVDADALARLAREPSLLAVYPESDGFQYHLAESARMVGAPQAREAFGVDGTGVGVFVLDSGIDGTHPDLADRLRAQAHTLDPQETGLVPVGHVEGSPHLDWVGHGTHVAGIIAGTGAALGEADPTHGLVVGMAPGAHLVGWNLPFPVAARYGPVSVPPVQTMDIVSGFEYALANQDAYAIRVSTNSWGFSGPTDPEDPISVATRRVYEAGIPVVFSAGNSGKPESADDHRTNPHGNLPWTLSVASVDKSGTLAKSSSRGTPVSEGGDPWDRPTIAAPGVSILSAKARGSAFSAIAPLSEPGGPGSGHTEAVLTHYLYGSGTSMAAPHVAGVIALMLDANPDLSPDQVYDILVRTAGPLAGGEHERGAGLVNASAAVAEAARTPGEMHAFLAGERKYDGARGLGHDALAAMREGATSAGDAPTTPAGADGVNATPPFAPAVAVAFALGAALVVRPPQRRKR